jgi:hypothetical protein
MFDIPRFFVSFELASFFTKRVHFRTAELDLKELMVVRNKERKLNIEALTSVGGKKQKKPVEGKKAKKEEPPQVTIDRLILKIGTVAFKDYSLGEKPVTRTFTIGLNEVYRNVTDLEKLVNLILVRALERTAIAQLAGFDLGALKLDTNSLEKVGQKELEGVGKTAGEGAVKELEKSLTDELNKKLK